MKTISLTITPPRKTVQTRNKRNAVKMIEGIFEFFIHLFKKAIFVAILGVAMCFTLVILTIFMPDEVISAFDIIKGFLS